MVSVLFQLLADMYYYYETCRPSPERKTENDAINSMMDFITRFYGNKIHLDDIARAGNVCRSKCCALFKSYLNLTPIEFLNAYRLSISKDMLISTNYRISVIAVSCGFPHQSYYTKLFLQKYGYTPNEYRLKNVQDSPNYFSQKSHE